MPEKTMLAYHWLRGDMRSGSGDEPPWKIGETRRLRGRLKLCEHAYHSSNNWLDGLQYAQGPMACRVLIPVSTPEMREIDKQGTRWRTLVAARDATHELRLFACDCNERALLAERAAGREPDPASWEAVAVARRFALGQATTNELEAAWGAAREAAWTAREAARTAREAAQKPAWGTAREAAWAAREAARTAREAAQKPAWEAARAWQCDHLAALLDPLFADVDLSEVTHV